jgi:hypothetical protein
MPKNTGRGSRAAAESADAGRFLIAKTGGGSFRPVGYRTRWQRLLRWLGL